MENNLKYFQPEISDIRIGYECELFLNKNGSCEYPEEWIPISIPENAYRKWSLYDGGDQSELDHIISLLDNNQVRTPYLTKEQIEAEGWVDTYLFPDETSILCKGNNLEFHEVAFPKNSNKISVTRVWDISHNEEADYRRDIKFKGECKSINEFKIICKLLNIK